MKKINLRLPRGIRDDKLIYYLYVYYGGVFSEKKKLFAYARNSSSIANTGLMS